ncbi:hypothetical protein [Dactylosporangium sp. CA-139066]|uniref:hypothetical protein n=1 Tax=Dactylosporangium sp. CA-139066 TaxID=3239930 RepID=UPI003D940761
MSTPQDRDDQTPVWQQESGWNEPGWNEPGWKEPERRLTGIVLPSFDAPGTDDLDEFERDRRSRTPAAPQSEPTRGTTEPAPYSTTHPDPYIDPRSVGYDDLRYSNLGYGDAYGASDPLEPAGPPVRVVPSGPPPAWPPPEPDPALEAEADAQPRREFPRYVHGEFVLPADEFPSLPEPSTHRRSQDDDFDPLTAPVEVLAARLHAPLPATAELRTALPSWAMPPSAPPEPDQWQRTPYVDLPADAPPPPLPSAAARTQTAQPSTSDTSRPLDQVSLAAPEAARMTPAPAPPTGPSPTGPSPAIPGPAVHGPAAPGPATWAPQPSTGPATTPPPRTSQHTLTAPTPAAQSSRAAVEGDTAQLPAVRPAPPAHAPAEMSTAELLMAQTNAQPAPGHPALPDGGHPGVPHPDDAGEQHDARRAGGREGAPHPAFPDATARTFRILPIAADLLPLEIAETRHARRLRRLVISGVVVVAALVGGWYGYEVHRHTVAQNDLQSVVDTQQDLIRQRHRKYDDLIRIQGDSAKIDKRLAKVMGRDLSWSRVLADLRGTAGNHNVKINGITAALLEETGAQKATGDNIGTITVTGTAASKSVVADYVIALATLNGIANPFPSDVTEENNGVSFTIRMDITRAALGGRFTGPSASPAVTVSPNGGK